MIKPLFLIMQSYWFDEIESGRKTEEYRDKTDFYKSRFLNKDRSFKNYETAILQEGYHKNARRMVIEVKRIELDDVFTVHLGNILERQNFENKPIKKAKKPKEYTYESEPLRTSKTKLEKIRSSRRKR